ncbi:MAG: 23S rRNA (pseudouridine(1915)-N(3))-methyltransferase RlmH [Desulfatiglandales bacterium]
MLRIKVIVVGRTRAPFLLQGERFYLERLRRYVKTDWSEVKAARMTKGRPEAEIIQEEGLALLKRVGPEDCKIPLDRNGTQYDSRGLARRLESLSRHAGGPVCFLVGGALGLSDEVIGDANEVLSLSRLTLTHEMTRLVLLEQLYRACTIMAGEKYHK